MVNYYVEVSYDTFHPTKYEKSSEQYNQLAFGAPRATVPATRSVFRTRLHGNIQQAVEEAYKFMDFINPMDFKKGLMYKFTSFVVHTFDD